MIRPDFRRFPILFLLAFPLLVSGLMTCENPASEASESQGIAIRHAPIARRLPEAVPDSGTGTQFDILSCATTGLDFNNAIRLSYDRDFFSYRNLFNGAGVGIADFNRDGRPDIWFAGQAVEDRVFLNAGGLRFRDVTATSGLLTDSSWSNGITVTDINSDGWPDVYVTKAWYMPEPARRANQLYVNTGDTSGGNVRFREAAAEYGLADTSFSMHASFFDYDLDGDLDMYQLNHPIDFNDRRKLNNHEKIEGGINHSDRLYERRGDRFVDVSLAAGINNHGFGLSVTIADLNGDYKPDIHVSNDWGMQDHMYINQGDGTFRDESLQRTTRSSFSSMGSDIADYNNDLLPDIVTVEIEMRDHFRSHAFTHAHPDLRQLREMEGSGYHTQYYRNCLHMNHGKGQFTEVARASGVASSEWSWSPLFVDFDHDGHKDLFISNGFYRHHNADERPKLKEIQDAYRRRDRALFDDLLTRYDTFHLSAANAVFHNRGNGQFTEKTLEWGTNAQSLSYGAGYADFDGDGDMDMVVNNMNACAWLYQNRQAESGSAKGLSIRLQGPSDNPYGFGAQVIVDADGKMQFRHMTNTRGYASTSDFVLHFGLGNANKADEIRVRWPDGTFSELRNVATDGEILIDHAGAKKDRWRPKNTKRKTYFTDITEAAGIQWAHKEKDFDDFYRNYLQPRMLSREGPALTVADFNGDKIDDFFVGGASGQHSQIGLQGSDGRFELLPLDSAGARYEDRSVAVLDLDEDGDPDLLVGSCSSEFADADSLNIVRAYLNDGTGKFSLVDGVFPIYPYAASCLRLRDIDNDGDLDLFAGNRMVAGHFPARPNSFVFRNHAGRFSPIIETQVEGMVTDAIWNDFDGDGNDDLLVAGEWMRLTMLMEDQRILLPAPYEEGFGQTHGWWNVLAAADMDKDGDMDFIAGNQGLNVRYRPRPGEPLRVYHGPLNSPTSTDLLVSYMYAGQEYPVPLRDQLSKQIPALGSHFGSYTSYGTATLADLRQHMPPDSLSIDSALIFSSCYIENTGDQRFKLRPLPFEAQISTVMGLLTGDFTGDGHTDILLQGNFRAALPQWERQDAFRGLLLAGDGQGGFRAVPERKSGFVMPGEGRALALIQLHTGQRAVLAAQSAGPLKLFRINDRRYAQ